MRRRIPRPAAASRRSYARKRAPLVPPARVRLAGEPPSADETIDLRSITLTMDRKVAHGPLQKF